MSFEKDRKGEYFGWVLFFLGAVFTVIYCIKFLWFTPSGLVNILLDTVIVVLSLTLMFIGVEGIFDTGVTLRV